jgi:hypothetical protein
MLDVDDIGLFLGEHQIEGTAYPPIAEGVSEAIDSAPGTGREAIDTYAVFLRRFWPGRRDFSRDE